MKKHPFSTVEILEARIAPAGLVDVDYNAATGELILTGDAAANLANVFQTGPNTHRIEGITTSIEAGGNAFFDIGKLSKLTIVGGNGSDDFTLTNLRTLTALSFSGGIGDDSLRANNVAVKGAVELHADAGRDDVFFNGVSTTISGNVTADSASAATDGIRVGFGAQKTVIGGSILFTGGGERNFLDAGGVSSITVSKGVQINAGTGNMEIRFANDGLLTIGKLTTGESILFNGGDGRDTLLLGAATATLSGGIRMTGGAENDEIHFGEESQTQTLKIGKLVTGESILFDGGADNDRITSEAVSVILAGGIDFASGDGINEIAFDASAGSAKIGKSATGHSIRVAGGNGLDLIAIRIASLTLAGGVELSGESGYRIDLLGSGKASLGKLATGQSILLNGSGHLDRGDTMNLDVASLTLAGGIEFAGGGDGSNTLNLGSPQGVAKLGKLASGQSILFTAGVASTNTLTTNGASLALAGGIELSAAGGTNWIDLVGAGKASIGKFGVGQSILLNGGSTSDYVTLALSWGTLAGGIELNADGGFNGLTISGVVNIGKSAAGHSALFTGATDASNDTDIYGMVTLAGSVEVTGGTGRDDIYFSGKVSVGKSAAGDSVLLVGGDGHDTIEFYDSVTLAGSLKFDGGGGNDRMEMTYLDSLTVRGAVEMTGGAGDDLFMLDAASLLLGNTLTISGGDGDDVVSIFADGSIAGDVKVDLGSAAAGVQQVNFEGRSGLAFSLALKGRLVVDADAANTTEDFLAMLNVSVARLIDLKLGGGASTVAIDNLKAGDEFKLETRGGADVVNIERGNYFGGSVINKIATIQLGLGDDQLAIGRPDSILAAPPDHTRVNFRGGLTADGGIAGTDKRNNVAGQNILGGALTLTQFEDTTIL